MKKREEIVKNISAYDYKFPDNVILELLLDIRELLIGLSADLIPMDKEHEGEVMVVDCNAIPDPKKVMEYKKKLDKLLKKP